MRLTRIAAFLTLSLSLSLSLSTCQHARVKLAPALIPPTERKAALPDDPSIHREKDKIIVQQNFYLFGLFPRSLSYDEQMLCPSRGIQEVHQFNSANNAILEQLTLGLYSPRTLEIICY